MEHKEPEWTAENINRKKGDTTFEICGWCEHASCGSCKYRCYLSTTCSLTKAYGIGHDVFWDTPCIVKNFGKSDFVSIIKSKEYEIKDNESQIADLKQEIQTIKSLSKKAKRTPPLPESRPHDYYNIDDVLYIFYEDKWNKGIYVSGYRHHDGCVSYVLEDYPESKGSWGCGYAVPCVLKEWEYRYFRTSPDKFKIWLGLCDKEYNGKKLDLHLYHQAITT